MYFAAAPADTQTKHRKANPRTRRTKVSSSGDHNLCHPPAPHKLLQRVEHTALETTSVEIGVLEEIQCIDSASHAALATTITPSPRAEVIETSLSLRQSLLVRILSDIDLESIESLGHLPLSSDSDSEVESLFVPSSTGGDIPSPSPTQESLAGWRVCPPQWPIEMTFIDDQAYYQATPMTVRVLPSFFTGGEKLHYTRRGTNGSPCQLTSCALRCRVGAVHETLETTPLSRVPAAPRSDVSAPGEWNNSHVGYRPVPRPRRRLLRIPDAGCGRSTVSSVYGGCVEGAASAMFSACVS